MPVNRKEFLKKACLAGACMCGFGLPAVALGNQADQVQHEDSSDKENIFVQNWIANLLNNLDADSENIDLKSVIKKNAEIHFDNLKMNEMLKEYLGKPDEFIAFISEKWGWKVDYDKTAKTITANENKSYCVCPVMKQLNATKTGVICNCSEGFAEKMFSAVFGSPVRATVVSSVLKGDQNCIYKIVVT